MRLRKSSAAERVAAEWLRGPGLVAGVDEVGRGPLAGPVVAAAVILDLRSPIRGLKDSKLLSPKTRDRLHDEIRARALCCAVGAATVDEIDRLNILQATMLAMRRAVDGLRLRPQRVLVDGNRLPALSMAAQAVVQGDAKVRAISAASIVAKVHRDRLCAELHERHPEYGFGEHKGYATVAHLAALRSHGACVHHRRSFAPVRAALGPEAAAAWIAEFRPWLVAMPGVVVAAGAPSPQPFGVGFDDGLYGDGDGDGEAASGSMDADADADAARTDDRG